MRAYVYSDDELLRALPMSLEQIERARVNLPDSFDNCGWPDGADIFWIPVDLGHIEAYHSGAQAVAQCLPRLQHWRGNEARHVGYFCSDGADPTGLPCIMFRQSFWKNNHDANVVAWPYAVEDFGALVTSDFSTLQHDVCFVGQKTSHPCRVESFDSVYATHALDSYLNDSAMHWGSIEHTEIGKGRKRIFTEAMRDSALVLAARGGGLSCYRFFEAMSAGRVAVLIADDVVLPHADLIAWDDCIIHIPQCRARQTGQFLLEFLRRISDDELAWMGQAARSAWVKYLAPAAWPTMMKKCVGEILAK